MIFKVNEFILHKYTGHHIRELNKLQHLHRGLRISGLHIIVCAQDALEANMRNKKYLSELSLAREDDGVEGL